MRLSIVYAGLLLAVANQPLAAQTNSGANAFLNGTIGTTAVNTIPQFSDGKLHSCIIEYNVVMRDHIYRQGGVMKVFGSFGLISANGNLAVALKIVVQDIDMKTYQFKPSAPANSYFVFGSETSRSDLVASYPSDTPGAQFSVFQPLPAFARISDQLDNGTVTIAFNRKNGGTDVLVPFDVTVSNTDDNGKKSFSSKMVLEFYQCTGELIKSVRSTNH